jgi:uncharacterized protein (TIGR00299 family) protein
MKNILYIDCFSGISGDMTVGALMDLGLELNFLRSELKKMDLGGYNISCNAVSINSISAKKFNVEIAGSPESRDYKEIKRIIGSSGLQNDVKRTALKIFQVLAEAEAKVHGTNIDKIHFHEVGAADSIVDIVSTAVGIKSLGIDVIYSSKVPLGSGFVSTMHGKLPVPAPATLEILKGCPVYGGSFDFEVTTPTGAAILKTLVGKFGVVPPVNIEKIGCGAGSKKNEEIPNVLRIIKGSIEEEADGKKGMSGREDLILLSTNIDDSTPEILGYLMDKLYRTKVLDAWVEPIYMKKNRPAFKLCAICDSKLEHEVVNVIFRETTTLGIRREIVERYIAARKIKKVKLPYGEVKVKIGIYHGKEVTASPEFESCRKLAQKLDKPLKEVYQDATLLLSSKKNLSIS